LIDWNASRSKWVYEIGTRGAEPTSDDAHGSGRFAEQARDDSDRRGNSIMKSFGGLWHPRRWRAGKLAGTQALLLACS